MVFQVLKFFRNIPEFCAITFIKDMGVLVLSLHGESTDSLLYMHLKNINIFTTTVGIGQKS